MNSGLIARILAGTLALGAMGITVSYTSDYVSVQEGINALKEKGKSFYYQYLTSEEEKEALQSEFETLKTQYLGVLGKLGLGESATLEDVQNKLNSLAQGEKDEVASTIAGLLGIEDTTVEGITTAIQNLQSKITDMESDISRLQSEINKANTQLAQANTDQTNTKTALNNALAELNALGAGAGEGEEEEGSEPGGNGPVDPVEPTLEEVQAELDSIWSQFSTLVAGDSTNFTNGRVIRIKDGYYTLDNTDGYKVLVENGSTITIETNEQMYNLLSQYKENLELYNTLLAQQ